MGVIGGLTPGGRAIALALSDFQREAGYYPLGRNPSATIRRLGQQAGIERPADQAEEMLAEMNPGPRDSARRK